MGGAAREGEGRIGRGEDGVPYADLNHGLVRKVLQILYIGETPSPIPLSLSISPSNPRPPPRGFLLQNTHNHPTASKEKKPIAKIIISGKEVWFKPCARGKKPGPEKAEKGSLNGAPEKK